MDSGEVAAQAVAGGIAPELNLDGSDKRSGVGARQRILIIHQNFPGQFRHIAQHLAARPDVEVIGLGRNTAPGLPDFPWFKYKLHREAKAETHPYLRQMEAAVLHGQAVARALAVLKRKGFVPDVILAHPGWGETLYAKEIYPQARLIHFCEWYYSTTGADFGFDPEFPTTLDDRLRINTWNALHLLNLQNCDAAIAPTHWQKSRFPEAYQDKIQVIHEGIDTENLGPDPHATLTLPSSFTDGEAAQRSPRPLAGEGLGERGQASITRPTRHSREGGNPEASDKAEAEACITLRAGTPVITYVARNLEPYRGFHQFMRALPAVLKAHPTTQVLIVGGDSKSYGSLPKDAPHWRAKLLRELRETHGEQLDQWLPRMHFLGKVPYTTYKQILQISAVHVYLTYPFVLSWSLLEAMATGCWIIASDTAPVREVIRNGENGELVAFFDSAELSQKILAALSDPGRAQALRTAARATAQAYGLDAGLCAYEPLLNLAPMPPIGAQADSVKDAA